jgi:hypothetical protein
MRGVTLPRPVRVEKITLIGKEVIVDPTDSDEGLTAEMLSETTVVEYQDPGERRAALRSAIRKVRVKAVSRESGVSLRPIQAFINDGTTPHPSTIVKLETAVRQVMRHPVV